MRASETSQKLILNLLDLHEFHPLPRNLVDRQQIADARAIELVFKEARLQGGSLLGFQAVIKATEGNSDRGSQAGHFREVLGVTEIGLLTVEVPDGWMGFHNDSLLRAVNAGHECAIYSRD